MIICPGCREKILGLPDEGGQTVCPHCGSYFSVKWAKDLEEFEREREKIAKEERE